MSLAPDPVNDQSGRVGRYASLEAAAEYYDVSPRTMRRAIADGRLPAVRVGRQIRIAWADLDALARPIPSAAC